ncbi:MAG: response regulator [Saprospiraceae bacterium]|nr:response regulator [Saprospiraceae bacterium]
MFIFKKNISLSIVLWVFTAYHSLGQQAIEGPGFLASQPFIFAQAPDSLFDLTAHALLLADTSLEMEWPDAKKQYENGAFLPLENFPWPGKFERGKLACWLAVAFETEGLAQPENVVFTGVRKDQVDFFLLANGTLAQQGQVGAKCASPNFQGEIPVPAFGDFPLRLQPGKRYLLLVRLRSWLGFHVPFRPAFYSPTERAKELSGQSFPFFLFHGFFFGVLLFVGLLTFLQFAQNRDRAYLWYTCYLTSLFVFYLREFNNYNAFFHVLPAPVAEHSWYMPLAFGQYFFYLVFVNAFLETKTSLPVLYRLSKRLMMGMAAFLVLERVVVFIDPYLAWEMTTYARVAFLLVGLYLLFLVAKSLDKLSKFILAGTLLLMLSNLVVIFISQFHTSHAWGVWDFSHIPAFVGVLLEILIFSAGLGYKSKMVEMEKAKAENMAQHLAEMDGLKNRLFTNITHEFRTPLTVILGLADEVEKKPTFKTTERLQLLKKNGRQLLRLVNQLLDLARMDGHAVQLEMVQDDVIGFLQVLTDSYQSFAASRHIGLQFFSEEKELWMDFDPNRLQQLVGNLLSNAFKFTPAHGQVLVFAKKQSENGGNWLEIRVKDTGVGIPSEEQPKVFDRFYRANQVAQSESEGTGVGLALVKELAGLMEGQVWLESEPGRGSVFFVKLPIRTSTPLAEKMPSDKIFHEKTAIPAAPLSGENRLHENDGKPIALVIEDNADVLYYIRECLLPQWQVLAARTGEQGIELAFEHIPDVVVSDVMMPGMDGFEVCEKLKSDERTSHIPVLLLTAKATQADRVEGLSKGADAYLVKPFDRAELLQRLDNFAKLKENLRRHLQLPGDAPVTPESIFLEKAKTLIGAHLSDVGFTSEKLGQELGMSRSQLHRKMKSITGDSTSLFIRKHRLWHAKKLLETTGLPVSEVAWSVGFDNLSWFSQAFREEFGVAPREVRK